MTADRPRRSALFMPASNPRAIARARTLPCDVIILDLEDAVAPEMKAAARAAAVETVAGGGFGHRELVIRINALDSQWAADDLAAVAAANPDAVLIPKVSDATTLVRARAGLGDGGPPLWAMIETARAIVDLAAIVGVAGAARLRALVAGTNDLAAELRCRPGDDRAPLLPALGHIVLLARAAGIAALDGVCNALDDPERLARECEQGRAWGFDGKTLIHPGQIDAANRAFAPAAADVAWADAVIAAFADPAETRGAIRIDGRMVERLHLGEALRIVAVAAAIGKAST